MYKKFFDIINDQLFNIRQETENAQVIVKMGNDGMFSKIVDIKKLKEELHKYLDSILLHIDSIRGLC